MMRATSANAVAWSCAVTTTVAVLVLSLCSSSCSALARDCPANNPARDGYDFQTLLDQDVWVIHGQPCNSSAEASTWRCSYYFTLCQPLPATLNLHYNCSNSSFCRVDDSTDPPLTTNIGDAETLHYENRQGLESGSDFVLGFTVPGTPERSLLAFFCNSTVSWKNPEKDGTLARVPILALQGIVHTGYDNMVDINLNYDGACLPPSGSSGGLGGGAIFAIVLFVLLAVYLVGGTFFNMAINDRTGIEALPNYGTWSSVGNFIKNGCRSGSAAEKESLVTDAEQSPFGGGVSAGGGYGAATGSSGTGGGASSSGTGGGGGASSSGTGGGGKGSEYDAL